MPYVFCPSMSQLSASFLFSSISSKILQPRFQQYTNQEIPDVQLDLEKAEEAEIKLPTSTGSQKKAREFQKSIYFSFIDYAKTFDCVDHKKTWKICKDIGIPYHHNCLLKNLYEGQEATVRTRNGKTVWFQIEERNSTRLYIVTLLI